MGASMLYLSARAGDLRFSISFLTKGEEDWSFFQTIFDKKDPKLF